MVLEELPHLHVLAERRSQESAMLGLQLFSIEGHLVATFEAKPMTGTVRATLHVERKWCELPP